MYMAFWKDDHKEKIQKWLGKDIKCCFASIGINTVRTNPVQVEKIYNSDLVIAYNPAVEVYIVWNSYVHRGLIQNQQSHTFSVPPKYVRENYRPERKAVEGTEAVYRKLQGDNPKSEKLLVIERAYMQEFCKCPFGFLLPDPMDENYVKDTLFASPNHTKPEVYEEPPASSVAEQMMRERISCTRIKRDARFRKSVLQKYNPPHCVVCGTSISCILEAAHICAVCDNGEDSPENGICLCSNHHKLWDDGKLTINFLDQTYTVSDDEVAEWMRVNVNSPIALI